MRKEVSGKTLTGDVKTCAETHLACRKPIGTSVATLIPSRDMVGYTNHVININTRVTARVMMVLSRWRRDEGSAFTKDKSQHLHVSSELVKTKEQKA